MARVLERLPCALQEEAMLRIHDLCLALRDTEEVRIETVDIVENAARLYDVWLRQLLGRDIFTEHLFVRERTDRLNSRAKVLPEFGDASRAREASGHPDDRDLLALC